MRQDVQPPRTILCIDDDYAIVAYVRALFERLGYRVFTTTSAIQGVTMAMMSEVDAVVLDYHMPEMGGDEVIAQIKWHRPNLAVVMFSAAEIPDTTLKLADAVVAKTDAVGQLLPTVMHLCERSHQFVDHE